jgi:flagellar basal-body rod protein FlgF
VLGDDGPLAVPPNASLLVGSDGTISIVPLGQGPETRRPGRRIKLVNPPAGDARARHRRAVPPAEGGEAPAEADGAPRDGRARGSNVNAAGSDGQHDRTVAPLRPAGRAMRTAEENGRIRSVVDALG